MCNPLHILNHSGTPKIRYFRSEYLSSLSPHPSASRILIIISPSCTHMACRKSTTVGRGRRQNMLVHQLLRLQKGSINLMAEFGRRNYERHNTTCASNYLLIKDLQLMRLTSDILWLIHCFFHLEVIHGIKSGEY